MKRLFGIVVTLSLATILLLPAMPVSAIQNGTPDGNNHPYVCIVVFYDFDETYNDPVYGDYKPLWRTTGELISPTVVLTAGHGTDGTDFATVWFLSVIPGSAPGGYPYYGGQNGYTGVPHTNPDYRSTPLPGLPGFDYHDVGVVVLGSPVPTDVVSTYAALPEAGLVDTLAMKTKVDLVGYGVTSQDKGGGVSPYDSWTWNRQRNYAPGTFVSSKDILASEFMKLSANPGLGKGGTTFGDSGGPILLAGTSTILGINAFVNNANCDGVTYAQRIDIPDILEWIEGFLLG